MRAESGLVLQPRRAIPGVNAGQIAVDISVALTAAVWLFFLSGWLQVAPGKPITTRVDVLFSADVSRWLEGLDGQLQTTFSLRHPLKWFTILPLGEALVRLGTPVFGHDTALVLAGRFLNALFGGLGVACLFRATRPADGPRAGGWVALAVYMFFSSMAMVALPEHFGISSGLLSLVFLLAILLDDPRQRARVMLPAGIVLGGLTLTNGLYPLWILLTTILDRWGIKRRWYVPVAVMLTLVAMPAVVAVGAHFAGKVRGPSSQVMVTTNLRLVKDPAAAALYAAHGLVDPAVAPSAHVAAVPYVPGNVPGLTLEPLGLGGFGRATAAGAAAWVLLLALSIRACLGDAFGRRVLWLTVPWLLFNLVFHNLWGDEFFLYSPHWSWCLGALLLTGSQRLPTWLVAVLALPIMFGQIATFIDIRSALLLM
jgi:hypothetical protein